MLKSNYKIHVLITLAVATLASVLLARSWPLLIFNIILITVFLPLPEKISNIASRVLISITLILSIIQIIGILSYVLHMHMDTFVYNFSIAVLLSAIALVFAERQKVKIKADDLWIAFVPFLVVGVVVGSMLTLVPKIGLDRAIVYKTTTSSDESQHLSMFAELIDNGGNITVSPKAYPTGWHLAMSVVTQSFIDLKDPSFMQILREYYITKIFSMGAVLMAIMVLFVVSAKRLLKDYSHYYLLFALGTILLALLVVIPNSEINAFYNFVPQYIYFLLLTALLIAKERVDDKVVYSILLLFAVASFISWILSGIILMALTASAFASRILNNMKIRPRVQKLITSYWQPVTLLMLGAAATIVIMPGGLIGRSIDLLEHPGGWVEGVGYISYLVLFTVLLREIFTTKKTGLTKEARTVLGVYFVIMSGIVMVTMLRGYGENFSYYWQKMGMPLLLMATPIAITYITARIQEYSKGVLTTYCAVIVLVILSVHSIFGVRTPSLALKSIANQSYLHKPKDLDITKPIVNLFEKNNFRSEAADRYIFVTSSNYTLDQMVYQLMSESIVSTHAAVVANRCFPSVLANGGYVGDNMSLLESVPSEYCGHKVKIIVSNDTINQVRGFVSQDQIININQ